MPVPNSIDDLSPVPANNSPSGSEQVFPNLDDYLRMHASCIAQLRDLVSLAAPEIGVTKWWGGVRTYIPAHNLPPDGQILNRADYPKLWAIVSAGGYPMISDSDWLATPTKRASFSSGNGSTTFRMPDLNGKSENSIGSVTLRGDGASSAGASGLIQDSQNLSHTHTATIAEAGSHTHPISTDGLHTHGGKTIGDLLRGTHEVADGNGGNDWVFGQIENAGSHTHTISSNGNHTHTVSLANSGGTEARGKVATGVWVMRVE